MSKLNKKLNTKPTTKVVDHEQADKTSTGATPTPPNTGTPSTEATHPADGAIIAPTAGTVAVDATTEGTLPDNAPIPEGADGGGSDDESGGASGVSTSTGAEDGKQEGEQILGGLLDGAGAAMAAADSAMGEGDNPNVDHDDNWLGTKLYYYPNHGPDLFSMFPPKDELGECMLEEMRDLDDCKVFTSPHQIKCNIKDAELEARMVDAFMQTYESKHKLALQGLSYDYTK